MFCNEKRNKQDILSRKTWWTKYFVTKNVTFVMKNVTNKMFCSLCLLLLICSFVFVTKYFVRYVFFFQNICSLRFSLQFVLFVTVFVIFFANCSLRFSLQNSLFVTVFVTKCVVHYVFPNFFAFLTISSGSVGSKMADQTSWVVGVSSSRNAARFHFGDKFGPSFENPWQ